jgi:hypothetical protein
MYSDISYKNPMGTARRRKVKGSVVGVITAARTRKTMIL